MKIKILNKNNNHPSIDVNGFFNIDEGCVFTKCFNETLDSGVITISNLFETINIEPYDIVYIYDDDETNPTKLFTMCVDTYTETMLCVNPKLYKYEISLFSETKQLENIILPNLKITKVWQQTRTIYEYINQYMTEYCPYIRIGTDISNYSFQPKWNWENLEDIFTQECPEMQWNTPTLREVLNDLMMVQDCIPYLEDGELKAMDLTKYNPITNEKKNKINYITKSKSSEDCVSELQMPLVNVTNKEIDNVVTKIEYCVFDTPEDEVVSRTNNVRVNTQYPIYNLKSFKMMFPICYDAGNNQGTKYEWISQDLMNVNNKQLVIEQKEWMTKEVSYGTNTPSSLEEFASYQNWCLYYVRGGNEILNFDGTSRFFGSNLRLLEELPIFITKWKKSGSTILSSPKWYNILFAVEYETLEGCVFRASKNDNVEHERVVIDNQTNSYVDSYSQGFLEYQKANRLGNEQISINARFEIGENLIEIAEEYEDSIIYQCQYQYFKNHVEINALATKNYVLREYFTGVKSKIRSWAIASGSEALTRHDLVKYYCEFSWDLYRERQGLSDLMENNIALYLSSPLRTYSAEPLKNCAVRTYDYYYADFHPEQIHGANPHYYCLDLISRIVGNSLVFTFGFKDNYWAGKSYLTIETSNEDKAIEPGDITNNYNQIVLDNSNLIGSPGGVPTYQHAYTNSIGEYDYYEVIFNYGIHAGSISYSDPEDSTSWASGTNNLTSQTRYFLYLIYQRPVIDQSRIYYSGNYDYRKISFTVNHKKDSQEITNLSTQFEFSTDTTDICFSKEFLKRQQAINTSNNSNTGYRLLIYLADKYNFRNPNELPKGTPVLSYTAKLGIRQLENVNSNLNSMLVIAAYADSLKRSNPNDAIQVGINISRNACLYLVDENDKPLLAFKNVPIDNIQPANITGNTNEWWPYYAINFNILRIRNKNIYSADNHYLKVGTIKV